MHIESLTVESVQQPMIALHQQRWGGMLETSIVSIAAGGETGYGSARAHGGTSGRAIGEYIVTTLAPGIIGQHALDRERIWRWLWSFDKGAYVPIFAISAIDVALWDLAGKLARTPVAKLIGGFRDRVPAYASSAVLGSIDDYVADVERARGRGYRAYKIHAFREAKRDLELCEALAAAAGPKMELMLDAANAYDRREALWVGRAIERLGFRWYEEPLSHHDIEGYRELRTALDIPLVGGETLGGGPYLLSAYQRAGAFDLLQADVYWKGGITGALKIARMAEAHGLDVTIHHGGSPMMNWANLHLLGATGNTDFLEVLVPEESYEYGLTSYPTVDATGEVTLPQAPGLGFEPDRAFIAANTTWSVEVR